MENKITENLNLMIDHTILRADATRDDIINHCNVAKQYNFASVCINPCHIKLVKEQLIGTNIKVCTVIGFPLGANSVEVKAFEAKKAVEDGAEELDMVINIGALKDKNYEYLEQEIKDVVLASKGALVKVIIETCCLTGEEKRVACQLAKKAGANFVKTSTGFGSKGATVEDIKLMREVVGPEMGVKAAGGIATFKEMIKMIEAGANRIGTSKGKNIVDGCGSESL